MNKHIRFVHWSKLLESLNKIYETSREEVITLTYETNNQGFRVPVTSIIEHITRWIYDYDDKK